MKVFFITAAICIASLCSCEEKLLGEEVPEIPPTTEEEETPTSLAGTTWKNHYDEPNGEWWGQMVIAFTSTEASFTKTSSYNNGESFTGRYTYDPPEVVIYSDNWTLIGQPGEGTYIFPGEIEHEGTVNGETLTIRIISPLDCIAFTWSYQMQ